MKTATVFFEWAAPMAADIDACNVSCLITSLSLHVPRTDTNKPINTLWRALKAAAARGVRIDFILPAPATSHPATAMNGSAAARLYDIGCRAHFATPGRLLHAKTAVIDENICWIGSGNWTAAASAYNHESYIRAESPDIAERLKTNWIEAGFIKGF